MHIRNSIAIAALIAGLAAPAAAAEKKNESAPIAIPAPPLGKGQIVFFRTGGPGFILGCSVNENGQKVSSLGAGRYFIMVTEPGRHEFTVKSEAKDVLALEVEADETLFSRCKIKMGIIAGRPDIAPSTEAEFREAKNLKMVDADDMGPGPGALRPEQVTAALATPAVVPPVLEESVGLTPAAEVPVVVTKTSP